MAGGGACLVRGAVDAATLARWRAAIDAHPAWTTRDGAGFVPWASSLRLDAVPALTADAIAAIAWRAARTASTRRRIGAEVAIAVDACWVRRQYAPQRYPARHAPHGWHQDGALGRGASASTATEGLLPMLTCWIALSPCGDDAPGLELARTPDSQALDPFALGAFASRDPAAAWRPVLDAGDALVFAGDVVHRTHVAPHMTRDRTSLEMRFVPHQPGARCSRAGRLRRFAA